MTDLEITKLCAEAIGWHIRPNMPNYYERGCWVFGGPKNRGQGKWFDPLRNKAQAMELAERFMLCVDFFCGSAQLGYEAEERFICWNDDNITRAICECVANMQSAKAIAPQPKSYSNS